MILTVAIPTYRRPNVLPQCLSSVADQLGDVSDLGVNAEILVVDNDAAGTAEAAAFAVGARYVIEPEPGLAAVRNRALDETGASRLLVFIDDDEVPSPGWLHALVQAWCAYGSSAVAGKVVSVLPPGSSEWAELSYRRPERHDGQLVDMAATNNILLDLGAVRALRIRFDEAFGLTGGEDTYFTRQLIHKGGSIRWSECAAVLDPVPVARTSRSWIIGRGFRAGIIEVRVARRLEAGIRGFVISTASSLAGGVGRILYGIFTVIGGIAMRSAGERARGVQIVSRGGGMVAGTLGIRRHEYARRRVTAEGAVLG